MSLYIFLMIIFSLINGTVCSTASYLVLEGDNDHVVHFLKTLTSLTIIIPFFSVQIVSYFLLFKML